MVKYCWFDHRVHDKPNCLVPELEAFSSLMTLFGAADRKLTSLPSACDSNYTCFIHADGPNGFRQKDWVGIADATKRRFVIFVSSHPETINVSTIPGVYALRKPLPRVVKLMSSEPARLEQFKRSCESGNPDMSCFGHPDHEHLIAAYLVGVALSRGTTIDDTALPVELLPNAQAEYHSLIGAGISLSKPDDLKTQLNLIRQALVPLRQGGTC